jgi:hypothetical protein
MTSQVNEEDLDSAQIGGNGNGKKSFDPGFKRNMTIVGGVFGAAVVLVLVLFLKPSGSRAGTAPRSDVTLGTGQTQQVDNMTPEMKLKLDEKQRQESTAAQKAGQTYIPPDPTGVTTPVNVQPQPSPGPSSLSVGTAAVTTHVSGFDAESDTRRREGLMRQMAMLTEGGSSGEVRQRIQAENREGSVARVATSSAGSAPASGSSTQQKRILVPGLSIAAAELSSDIKVPAGGQGFASARIHSGPAAGGFLVGTAKVTDESLEISFTQMRLGDTLYRVDAIVLDETTANNAIDGNVDRRLLQRYVLPITLAMAQGFFQAKAQTGSTVVSLNNTTAGVATPAPSTEQARSAGISTGLQLGGQEVQKLAQQPIVVSRGRNFPVGILFRAPVTEESQ